MHLWQVVASPYSERGGVVTAPGSQSGVEEVAARVEQPPAPRAATVTLIAALFIADMLALAFIDRTTTAAIALVIVAVALFIALAAAAGAFHRATWHPAPEEQAHHDAAIARLDEHERAPHISRWAQTHP